MFLSSLHSTTEFNYKHPRKILIDDLYFFDKFLRLVPF